MTEGFDREEDDLQHHQGGELYPLGRSLRTTFPPRDGETLQPRIASLMVELSHLPYDRTQAPALPPQPAPSRPSSMIDHVARFFRRVR